MPKVKPTKTTERQAARAARNSAAAASAQTLCESNMPGTTSELRRLATQRGIAHASTLTKKQLCVALAVGSVAQDEDVELPAGFIDLVTQEVMRDPIVASDGYSYDRTSLRNMFLVDARRFVEQGRPDGRPRRVVSLKDPNVQLQNPFSDIPGWPASFPFIHNHDLRHSINEWLVQHGMNDEEKENENESEPVYSRRDGDGFQYGIFVGNDANEESQGEDDDADADAEMVINAESPQDTRRTFLLEHLVDIGTYESVNNMKRFLLWSYHAQELPRETMTFRGISNLQGDIHDTLILDGDGYHVIRSPTWGNDVFEIFYEHVNKIDPALRFNALVHIIRNTELLVRGKATVSVAGEDIQKSIDASSLPGMVGVDHSFSALPRSRDGFVSGQSMANWAKEIAYSMEISVLTIGQDVWEMLREIDNGFLIRRFISHVPPYSSRQPLLGIDRAREILTKLDVYTYTQARDKLSTTSLTTKRALTRLKQKWEEENKDQDDDESGDDGKYTRRDVLRTLVDLFAANSPREQLIDEYKWIPASGAVVGIRKEALDMLEESEWTGFEKARDIVADLVAYVISTRCYIIDTREVQRALNLAGQ